MTDKADIPVLIDLIEKGSEITMSDLGLERDLHIGIDDPPIGETEDITEVVNPDVADYFSNNPGLEEIIRRILDDHAELAWQEIRQVIQHEFKNR